MCAFSAEKAPGFRLGVPRIGKNRAKSSHPYQGLSIKDGLEEVRWYYPESKGGGEVHVVDGTPFKGDVTRAVTVRTARVRPGGAMPDGLHTDGHHGA